ncbi:MAG: TlpA family protein disulfide reductase [Myxococcales bacterium]|nr:TlpA family protein disulfide reductase [Myxococcales bacterium]
MERFLGAKAVLVTVHAGWCTYCKQQAATMEDGLWQKYKDQGLQMLLISFQDEQGSSDRQKLLDYCCKNKADFHMTFTQSIDPNAAVTDQFFRPTEAGTPLNMLLDRRMRIRYKVEGVIPQSYILEGNIEGLLSED